MIRNSGTILRRAPFATRKAIDHYNKCAEVCRNSGYSTFLGITYLELGRFYKRKGKRDQAMETLSAAARIFKECEANASLKQAEDLLKSLDNKRGKA